MYASIISDCKEVTQCIVLISDLVDCAAVPDMLTLTFDPLTCNLDNTCNKVSCCVDSVFTNSTFEVVFDLNQCTRMLTLEIENLKVLIPYSEIQWGRYKKEEDKILKSLCKKTIFWGEKCINCAADSPEKQRKFLLYFVEKPSQFYLNSVVRLE